MWLEDTQNSTYSRCKKCKNANSRCGRCQKVFDCKVYLHYDIDEKYLENALRKIGSIQVEAFTDALYYFNKDSIDILTMKNIRYLEKKLSINIDLYRLIDGGYVLERRARIEDEDRYEKTMNIAKETFPESMNYGIEHFELIFDEKKLPKPYKCSVLSSCLYESDSRRNLERHEKICFKSADVNIQIQQKMYGENVSDLDEMIKLNILPAEARYFYCDKLVCWDIETQELLTGDEIKDKGMTEVARLKLLSIAVGSNFSDNSKCWRRRESGVGEDLRMVKALLKELYWLYDQKQKSLPNYFSAAEETVERLIFENKNGSVLLNRKYLRFRRYLNSIRRLDVYGFNSARFDMGVIAGPLFMELEKKEKLSVIKKGAAFFNASTEKLSFKDVLSFTAPCKLEKFLKTWKSPAAKSIWPYSYYGSVRELKLAKTFPPRNAFYSELTGQLPSMELYIESKREFARRRLLPKYNKDKIYSMYGWLKFYNITDVVPLANALTNCFHAYRQNFSVNPLLGYSLPSLALSAMFAQFPSESPYVMTPSVKIKDVHEKYRNSVYGGLVNVYKRHIVTHDRYPVPHIARHAPNGEPYSHLVMLDFTSMYLSCQKKMMPVGPGLKWQEKNGVLTKSVTVNGHSLPAQQWLAFMQETGETAFDSL